jgi:hypothetical protein
MDEQQSAGDAIPARCAVIEVRVGELWQLFDQLDPSPFQKRDLDPAAARFIVEWADEVPGDAPLALLVHLDRPAGLPTEPAMLRDAIRQFFGERSVESKRELRRLFRRGRTSLAIGLTFLGATVGAGDLIANAMNETQLSGIIRESFLIGGWVAMWRPLEVFLYDWWPIRSRMRLYDRLAVISVRITYAGGASTESWQHDWPAAAKGTESRRP